MKKSILVLLLFVITAVSTQAQFIAADVKVSGLTCSMCSNVTEKSLKTLDFVDSISADLNTTTFKLYFKKNKPIVIDMIAKKVEDAGFSVSELIAHFNFKTVNVEKDTHWSYEQNVYHFIKEDSKVISGIKKIRFLDKNFVTKAEHKKYLKEIKFDCYTIGKPCEKCTHNSSAKMRIYHIQLI